MSSSLHTATDGETTVWHGGDRNEDGAPDKGGVLGRYVVVDTLGVGAMGRVVRAYDPKLRREVALKLLRFEGNAEARERLVSEAQSMAQLSHPNALPVYDIDFDDGRPFIAMEYVEGKTLKQWLADDAPSVREIVDAFLAAGAGLAAAHAVGIVHRDFKPANVLRGTDGRIRVMDFGLAAVPLAISTGSLDGPGSFETSGLTEAGAVLGTPGYMAPEQHAGEPVDARSDQYAFAIALWEALCGERPFASGPMEAMLAAKLAVDHRQQPGLPAQLRRLQDDRRRPALRVPKHLPDGSGEAHPSWLGGSGRP